MISLVQDSNPEHIKEWYRMHLKPDESLRIISHADANGYTFDPNSGLFLRPLYESPLTIMLVDIIFPRPTDLHYHTDVEETIKVIDGQGAMLLAYPLPKRIVMNLTKGDERILLPHSQHSFRPNRGTYLELRIAYDGKLDPTKEICGQRFDQVPEWVEYYSQAS